MSNAALTPQAKGGQSHIIAKVDNTEYVVGILEKGKTEQVKLDLFFSEDQNVSFHVKGGNEVHLSGYFEANEEEDDEDLDDIANLSKSRLA